MDKNKKILFLGIAGLMLGILNNNIFGDTICNLFTNITLVIIISRIITYLSFAGIIIFIASAILLTRLVQ